MNTKNDKSEVIVEIIRQDMRINQYLSALRKLGIEIYNLDIDLTHIVARLMNLDNEKITDSWIELYTTKLMECKRLPLKSLGQNLYPLAKECYNALLEFSAVNTSEKLTKS